MGTRLTRATASFLVSPFGFIVFAQAPSTSPTTTTGSSVVSTAGVGTDLTGNVLCTIDRIGSVTCLILPPPTASDSVHYQWTIDGSVVPNASAAAIASGPILGSGRHHIEVIAVTGTHRSQPLSEDLTVPEPPPIPGPDSVKFPWSEISLGVAAFVMLTTARIIRRVQSRRIS